MDDLDDKDDTKRKSRNLSEKKRRDQFNILVTELGSMVSPGVQNHRKMDKTTVLKTTIAFLKQHQDTIRSQESQADEIQENWKPAFLSNEEFTHLMLEALEGFILVLSVDGGILYASDNVTALLGYLPKNLTEKCIYELIEECDKVPLYNLLQNPPLEEEQEVNIYLHVKHGSAYCKTSNALKHVAEEDEHQPRSELIKLTGYFRKRAPTVDATAFLSPKAYNGIDGYGSDDQESVISGKSSYSRLSHQDGSLSAGVGPASSGGASEKIVFVSTARLQTPQLLREIPLLQASGNNEFTSRYSLEWKFLALDQRAPPIIGYLPFELLGTSGYEYYHMDDLDHLVKCHDALMQTGEGTTSYYRFLSKGQQWIWLQTRYFITYHQWNSKPEFVVATHKVISYSDVVKELNDDEAIEGEDELESSLDAKAASYRAVSPTLSSRSSVCGSTSTNATKASHVGGSFTGSFCVVGGASTVSDELETASQQGPASAKVMKSSAPVSVSMSQAVHPTSSAGSSQQPATSVQALGLEDEPNLPPMQMSPMTPIAIGSGIRGLELPSSSAPNLLISSAASLATSVATAPLNTVRPANPVAFSPAQAQLQTQLRTKHAELARRIACQQEELQAISEQLLMSQFGLVPVNVSFTQGQSEAPMSMPSAAPVAALNDSLALVDGTASSTSIQASTRNGSGAPQRGRSQIVYTSITSMPEPYQQ